MIPNLIHQIWIGPNIPPKIYLKTIKTFCKNKGYHYLFWDNYLCEKLLKNSKFLDVNLLKCYNLEKEWYGKADILRYLILMEHGGTYIDADIVILKEDKLDEILNSNYDFIIGRENEQLIANSVISCTPKHTIIKKCLENIPSRYLNTSYNLPWKKTGPLLLTNVIENNPEEKVKIYESKIYYGNGWFGIQDPNYHNLYTLPQESIMFQYGYSTNYLQYSKKFELEAMIKNEIKSGNNLKAIYYLLQSLRENDSIHTYMELAWIFYNMNQKEISYGILSKVKNKIDI